MKKIVGVFLCLALYIPCWTMVQDKKNSTSEQALVNGQVELFKKLLEEEKLNLSDDVWAKKLQHIVWKTCHGGMRSDDCDMQAFAYLLDQHASVVKNFLGTAYSPSSSEPTKTPMQTACRYRTPKFVEKLRIMGLSLDESCLSHALKNTLYPETKDYIAHVINKK